MRIRIHACEFSDMYACVYACIFEYVLIFPFYECLFTCVQMYACDMRACGYIFRESLGLWKRETKWTSIAELYEWSARLLEIRDLLLLNMGCFAVFVLVRVHVMGIMFVCIHVFT